MQEMQIQLLGWEDSPEKEMATCSSILTWRIPMDRGAWQATVHGITRVRHNLVTKPLPSTLHIILFFKSSLTDVGAHYQVLSKILTIFIIIAFNL